MSGRQKAGVTKKVSKGQGTKVTTDAVKTLPRPKVQESDGTNTEVHYIHTVHRIR